MILALVLAASMSGGAAARQPADKAEPHVAGVDESAPVEVPPPSAKAMAYYRSGNVWWIADLVLSVAVLVVFLATGFSARLRDVAARVGRKWLFTLVVWRESHPPLGERIDFTNQYHPWRDGQPLVYGDRFKR